MKCKILSFNGRWRVVNPSNPRRTRMREVKSKNQGRKRIGRSLPFINFTLYDLRIAF